MGRANSRTSRIIAVFMTVIMVLSAGMLNLADGGNTAQAAAITPVKINATNFPDPIFRSVISGPDYDRDGNGTLDAKELGETINIYCEGLGIKSIKGVEYFVNLQGLWCKDNKISSMDIRKLTDLRGLWCSGNPLTSLNLTQNKKLLWVYCYDCKLTALDVSQNPKMAFIECNTNPITKLDVTHNPELEHLTCGTCELTTLDLSKNPKLAHLDAFRNHFTKLDVTHNTKLKRLDVWDNPGLGSIDVSKCPGLQYYNCANNDATTVDVSHNPELQKLICSYNELKKLDLSKNPKLACLYCEDNQLTSLNLSYNPKLRYLQAAINNFTSLNIGNNPFLVKTYKEGSHVQEWFGQSWTIDYGGEDSTGGDNKFYIWLNSGITVSTKATVTVPATEERYSDLNSGITEESLLTREDVVLALYELAGKPSVSGLTTRFTDVKAGTAYTNALLWGEKNAICVGYPDTSSDTFGFGKWITRQDLVYMLMRYSEVKKYKRAIDFGRSDDYQDYFDIDYDHWEALCWSATWNIMEAREQVGSTKPGLLDAPKSELWLDPYGRVTRADFKKIMQRLFEVNSVTVTSSMLAILNKADLRIVSQPVGKSVEVGTAAKFKVVATGKAVTYQWQYRKNSSSSWASSAQSGNKTATLSVASTTGLLGYQFRCIVKDSSGKTLYSSAATLTVRPRITMQPVDKSVTAGSTAIFTVEAAGKATLTYQWQYRKNSSYAWASSAQSGNKTSTLSVAATAGLHGYQFRCVVTDGNGQKSYSNIVTLTLKPKITTQPVDKSVLVGATAKFSVAATGKATLTYQWQYRKDSSSAWASSAQSGNKTSTLSVATTAGLHGYQFRCVVTDGNGQKAYSNAVTLTVKPKITTQPVDKSVLVGATAKFSVAVTGKATLTYQWQYRKDSSSTWASSAQSGNKTATLSVATTKALNGYQFRCIVTDGNGQKTISSVVTLKVQ